MSRSIIRYSAVAASLLATALFAGCGASNKEGSATLDTVASVGDAKCVQCHSAVVDPLTGEGIIAQYENTSPHKDSAHANNGNGCEACHGGGAQHNGVGPIPYVNPYDGNGERCASCHKGKYATNAPTKFADSKHALVEIEEGGSCRRCHTHEGAVLGAMNGLTGDLAVMDNAAYQGAVPFAKEYTQFKCQTCHVHGGGLRTVKARNEAGAVVNWNPSKSNKANDQFNLCTSCHSMYNYNGTQLLADGSAKNAATGKPATGKVGHHENTWYRVIATTHFDNMSTGSKTTISGTTETTTTVGGNTIIEGYNIRKSGANSESPCFDCHAHEAKTNTGTVAAGTGEETIYTEWAKSGHAGGLLKAKIAAAVPKYSAGRSTAASVQSAMVSGAGSAEATTVIDGTITRVTTAGDAWGHYNWDKTFKADGTTKDRGDCQKCHTSTGAANYLNAPATYDPANNDFSHLSGWSSKTGSPQNELLYCWGCHSNSGAGVLRNPGAVTVDFKFNGAKAQFPDAGASNVCITCHAGRESGESITALADSAMSNVGFVNSHYMAAASLMYVKGGFTAFVDPSTPAGSSTYGKSLTSTDDGGALGSTHRKLGTAAMATDSHEGGRSLTTGGPCVTCHLSGKHHTLEMDANAFNNTCVKCHDEEAGTALTADNFKTLFLEEQEAVFQDALNLALAQLLSKYNISYNSAAHPYFYDLNIGPSAAVKDWTRGGALTPAEAKKLMGACYNINILKRDPAAYAHARTYARRLIYDSIDFLDDKTINMSTGATAVAANPVLYVKGATAKDPATTEAYKYLAGYNRTTGAWNTAERP